MAQAITSFDAGHGDTVHDVQLDYYGRRIATASSDRTIKVFDIDGDQARDTAQALNRDLRSK
jgi:protein transport protein SEC13